MDDTISRQAAIDAVKKNTFRLTFAEEQNCEGHVAWSAEAVYSDVMEGALLDLPSAQPEIIRCKDCKFASGDSRICMKFGHSPIGELDFCSWAEKKEDAESRWIPVTEKLPEEDKDVLCKTLAGVIFVASYGKLHKWIDEKGWIITPSLERAGISFVDYWMPLPEFYKEGEK